MSNSKQELQTIYHELAADFKVEDLITEQAHFLFLLESPHVQELKHGAPVSGSSGTAMRKHLYGEEHGTEPLGVLLKANRDAGLQIPDLNKAALMNVCQIPMQANTYPADIQAKYGAFLNLAEGLRAGNEQTKYRNQAKNDLQAILVEKLRHRLLDLQEHPFFIVPCGKFAQKFFRLADVHSPKWQVIDGVPHPSYNGWSKSEYAGAVEKLKAEFAKDQLLDSTHRSV